MRKEYRSVLMKSVAVGVALTIAAWSTQGGADPKCAIDGEPIQWVANYCMLKMQTDDEIAVSGCIEDETRKSFADSCASNLHFKRSMCEVVIGDGTKTGTVDQCVQDPAFKGRVVEANGVGA